MIRRSGVLVVAKVAGMTSFDVVAGVRRALKARRVGHAGTLDPDATGVLPILIGEATKLMPYLADQEKEYRVTIRLGITTDTLDLAGRVVTRRPVGAVDRAAVEAAAARLVGRIRQVPPMFSAVHHAGRRLYELAREGQDVARGAREVVVHAFDVETVADATVTLRVVCGKGTYVRVLAADLGEALGTGAAVDRLVRTRVGPFGLDDAVAWEEIAVAAPTLWSRVRAPEAALGGWPAVQLDEDRARAFVHGQAVAVPAVRGPRCRVHDTAGRLLGIGEVTADAGRVRPLRILHVDDPGTRVLPA
jgi:tRNA pseudouridine55 synthase